MSNFTHKAVFSFTNSNGVDVREVFFGRSPLQACRKAAAAMRRAASYADSNIAIYGSDAYSVELFTKLGDSVGYTAVSPYCTCTTYGFDCFNMLFDYLAIYTGCTSRFHIPTLDKEQV